MHGGLYQASHHDQRRGEAKEPLQEAEIRRTRRLCSHGRNDRREVWLGVTAFWAILVRKANREAFAFVFCAGAREARLPAQDMRGLGTALA